MFTVSACKDYTEYDSEDDDDDEWWLVATNGPDPVNVNNGIKSGTRYMTALNRCLLSFLTLKMSRTCTCHWMLLAITGDQYHVWVLGVYCLQPVILRCILCYISCANAVRGLSPVQKMFPGRTEATLDSTWTCSNTNADDDNLETTAGDCRQRWVICQTVASQAVELDVSSENCCNNRPRSECLQFVSEHVQQYVQYTQFRRKPKVLGQRNFTMITTAWSMTRSA